MMKSWLEYIRDQKGQVLPGVLVLLTMSALLVVPSLDFVAGTLKAEAAVEENLAGLYAAEAGIEDALWRLKHPPWPNFPYSYTLASPVNGMTVNVVIDYPEMLNGEETPRIGVHEDWLQLSASYSAYEDPFYTYTLSITSWYTPSVVRIERIDIVDLPAVFVYETGTTSGITTEDPVAAGGGGASLSLTWYIDPPYVLQKPDPQSGPETIDLSFKVRAPPGVYKLGFHAVTVTRQDIGTVTDFWPFVITARAVNTSGRQQASIRTGLWIYAGQENITDWQIGP
ncbi:MAG: hypothetical protein HYX96_07360 [Chloroflexi bacterium]|nr:hypothetical protein [Chloroflexota bacterium]